MAVYAAMASRFTLCDAAVEFKDLLNDCVDINSKFYIDGLHLNLEGVHQAAAIIERIVREHGLDAVVGDSCLCATEASEAVEGEFIMDKDGDKLQPLISVPCHPAAGKGFCYGGFSRYVTQAYYATLPRPKIIGVFVAGNDLWAGNSPAAVADEMDQLQTTWAEWEVAVVFINVVPDDCRGV
jgi:lysophospholipase L1-like esterase